MPFFGRPKERKTALQSAVDRLVARYQGFSDLERRQILSLIREVHHQTSSPCFEGVAIAAVEFFKQAAPTLASGGAAGDAILLALAATDIGTDLATVIPDFQRLVQDARNRSGLQST